MSRVWVRVTAVRMMGTYMPGSTRIKINNIKNIVSQAYITFSTRLLFSSFWTSRKPWSQVSSSLSPPVLAFNFYRA